MSYRITIMRTVTGERKTKDWRQVRTSETTATMVARLKAESRWPPDDKPTDFEYVEAVLPFKDEVKAYEQVVDELDLAAVIKAVNGLT